MNELHAPQSFFSGDNVTIMICLGIVVTAILIMVFFTYIIEMCIRDRADPIAN